MCSVINASTLANSPLSIFQQRIILIISLVVISAAAWWQNAGASSSNHSVQKFSKTPAPNAVAELDFTSAEASWSGLRIDSQGNLKIGALTHTALEDAIALIHDQASGPQMARMALLLEKQFGAAASQQIMALLPMLKDYRDIEQRWLEEIGSNNLSANKPPAYAELFQLQDELLGETLAKKMFSEQRRLANMMLASQQIQKDTNLSQAQKEQALMDLQKTFQEGAPNE
jgi:hypothetical protein